MGGDEMAELEMRKRSRDRLGGKGAWDMEAVADAVAGG